MRHKHADLIIAWANDLSIQLQVKNNEGNWDDIHKTPAWYENTEYRIKPKVWSPAHGQYHINRVGTVEVGGNKPMTEFGMSRPTKEAAERAAKEMRIHHRLLAYRDEFCPGYKPEWPSNSDDDANYVFKSGNEYFVSISTNNEMLGVVYFPRGVARELARKLNEGEVVL